MNELEVWIYNNNVPHPDDFEKNYKSIGSRIKNAIPPVFEAYALIYHPFKVPKGELLREKERTKAMWLLIIAEINRYIEGITGIDSSSLPMERYDFVPVLQTRMSAIGISKAVQEEKLELIDRELFQVVIKYMRSKNNFDEEYKNLDDDKFRDLSWQELHDFYGIDFSVKSTLMTIHDQRKSEDKIVGLGGAEMDIIPVNECTRLKEFLKTIDQLNVDVNILCGEYNERYLKENTQPSIDVEQLDVLRNVYLIAHPEKDWLILNLFDTSRTLVAGSRPFVVSLIDSGLFETTGILSAEQRIDSFQHQ